MVAELPMTEPGAAGVMPCPAASAAEEGQAAPMARRAKAAQDGSAARRIQVRAGASAGAREVTHTSLPTPDHLYRISQRFAQRCGLGDRDQAGEVAADIGCR